MPRLTTFNDLFFSILECTWWIHNCFNSLSLKWLWLWLPGAMHFCWKKKRGYIIKMGWTQIMVNVIKTWTNATTFGCISKINDKSSSCMYTKQKDSSLLGILYIVWIIYCLWRLGHKSNRRLHLFLSNFYQFIKGV